MSPYRRAGRIIVITLAAYAALVGTNLGEFWPFSIYPMFSQGGNPWSRAVVRDVTNVESLSWTSQSSGSLPGEPYPLLAHGVDPIDLANFISKSERWDMQRVTGLRNMFSAHTLEDRRLLVMRVNGRITPDDSVIVEFVPHAVLTAEATTLNEALPQ